MADDPNGGVKVNFERRRRRRARRSTRRCWCRSAGGRTAQIPGLDKTKVRRRPEGLHRGRRAAPHRRADDLRDRRRRRRADAGAQGVATRREIAVEAIAGAQGGLRAARDSRRRLHRSRSWPGAGSPSRKRKRDNIPHEVAKFPWGASGRATSIGRTDGLTKLIFDPKTERVLGVGIVGAGAGEMIAEGTLAVEMAAVATDLAMTIHAAPDAVRDGDGIGRRLLRPRHARLPPQEEVAPRRPQAGARRLWSTGTDGPSPLRRRRAHGSAARSRRLPGQPVVHRAGACRHGAGPRPGHGQRGHARLLGFRLHHLRRPRTGAQGDPARNSRTTSRSSSSTTPPRTTPGRGLAHEAAVEAGRQGKFWEMHDLLAANAGKLEAADLAGYAQDARPERRRVRRGAAGPDASRRRRARRRSRPRRSARRGR